MFIYFQNPLDQYLIDQYIHYIFQIIKYLKYVVNVSFAFPRWTVQFLKEIGLKNCILYNFFYECLIRGHHGMRAQGIKPIKSIQLLNKTISVLIIFFHQIYIATF